MMDGPGSYPRCAPLQALRIVRQELDRTRQTAAAAYVSMAIDVLEADAGIGPNDTEPD